jgi:hypothetical protein
LHLLSGIAVTALGRNAGRGLNRRWGSARYAKFRGAGSAEAIASDAHLVQDDVELGTALRRAMPT